jgi:hypothetical protein
MAMVQGSYHVPYDPVGQGTYDKLADPLCIRVCTVCDGRGRSTTARTTRIAILQLQKLRANKFATTISTTSYMRYPVAESRHMAVMKFPLRISGYIT